MPSLCQDEELLKVAFGWSPSTWGLVFLQLLDRAQLPDRPLKILELGAGRLSAISLVFSTFENEILITGYDDLNRARIEKKLSALKKRHTCEANVAVAKMSVTAVVGEYDLILMKSVMGGVCNHLNCTPEPILSEIIEKNLKPGGVLISLDNGRSSLDSVLIKFGARRRGWCLFNRSDFRGADEVFQFGLFSGVSFETRFGTIGLLFDKALFAVDCFIMKFAPGISTAVIGSMFRNAEK